MYMYGIKYVYVYKFECSEILNLPGEISKERNIKSLSELGKKAFAFIEQTGYENMIMQKKSV